MPGVTQNPGVNAGNTGNTVRMGRLHYTVGTDSTGIGVAGYFHFLVPKEGIPQQFAPTEAICWDACEWNPTGCGIEFERLSDAEPLTDNQISWGGQIIRWLSTTHGIPLNYRDSPDDRLPVGTPFAGFITHRSLHEVQCDEHYDYISGDDWNRMVGQSPIPPAPPLEELSQMSQVTILVDNDPKQCYLATNDWLFKIDDAGRQKFFEAPFGIPSVNMTKADLLKFQQAYVGKKLPKV